MICSLSTPIIKTCSLPTHQVFPKIRISFENQPEQDLLPQNLIPYSTKYLTVGSVVPRHPGLIGLASTVAAQYQGGQGQQQQQPIQGYQPSQGYQQPAQYQGYQPAQQASQGRWPRLSTQEISDWQGCTNLLLNAFNDNVPGSGPACEMWKCLHVQANKYGRGGALTTLSNALNPVCGEKQFHW